MAILKSAARLIIREHAHYQFRGPALTLGVPEIYATPDEITAWSREYLGAEPAWNIDEVEISTNRFGKRLSWVKARSFFQAIGIGQLDSLDIEGCEYVPEILHDLNTPLPDQFHNQYGLIFDPGTLEHVFDIRTCLQSIVKALTIGGTVIHLVPTYSYNGGYYSINPNVLTDFYTANGFTDIRAFVIMWDRYRPYGKQRSLCYEYRSDVLGSRHALADLDQVRYAPHLLLFARKEMAVEEFVAPLQFAGDYANQAAAVSATREQGLEKHARKSVRWLQENLPLGPVLYLQSFAYRWFTFWRARRKAGFRI